MKHINYVCVRACVRVHAYVCVILYEKIRLKSYDSNSSFCKMQLKKKTVLKFLVGRGNFLSYHGLIYLKIY